MQRLSTPFFAKYNNKLLLIENFAPVLQRYYGMEIFGPFSLHSTLDQLKICDQDFTLVLTGREVSNGKSDRPFLAIDKRTGNIFLIPYTIDVAGICVKVAGDDIIHRLDLGKTCKLSLDNVDIPPKDFVVVINQEDIADPTLFL